MTMSLSVARPIVCEPEGLWIAPERDGNNAWNILVARFDTDASGGLLTVGAIWVCGAPPAPIGGAWNVVGAAHRPDGHWVAAARR